MSATIPAWPRRILLSLWALGGSWLFAWSFHNGSHLRLMTVVAIAAGLSWPLLGTLLLRFAPQAGPLAWADACLETMGLGMPFLVAGAVLNFAEVPAPLSLHVGLLGVGGLAMTAVFLAKAHRLGLPWPRALLLWVLGLQAPFLVLLAIGMGAR